MRASLVSRETIADSIELVVRGHLLDGLVCIVGCDKTIPAAVMALARLDVPGLVLYNGSIAPGRFRGRDVTIQDVFEAVGAAAAGTMIERRRARARGRRLPGRRRVRRPVHREHDGDGARVPRHQPGRAERRPRDRSGEARRRVRGRHGSRCGSCATTCGPSHVMTRDALENAAAAVAATGGSTNGVLHLLAIAYELGIDLTIDEFDRIAARTPVVADIKPGGRFVATDLHAAGGVALVARELLKAGLVHGDAPNVDGRSLAEVATARRRDAGPGGRRPDRDAAQGDGRPRDPARQPRARRLRREARRPRAALPPRPGARLRLGGGVLRRGEGAADRSRATSS